MLLPSLIVSQNDTWAPELPLTSTTTTAGAFSSRFNCMQSALSKLYTLFPIVRKHPTDVLLILGAKNK